MVKMMTKLFLTDIDGCVLDWKKTFIEYMEIEHGYTPNENNFNHWDICKSYDYLNKNDAFKCIEEFNQSYNIMNLKPIKNSYKVLKELKEKYDYTIIGITSFSDVSKSITMRHINIQNEFPNIFTKLHCIPLFDCKRKILEEYYEKYGKSFWLEDNIINTDVGLDVGLDSMLFRQSHNGDYSGQAKIVHTWDDVREYILSKT